MVPNVDSSKSPATNGDEAALESIDRFRDDTLPTEGVDGPSIGGDKRDVKLGPSERDFLCCTSTGELNVLETDADAALICRCC